MAYVLDMILESENEKDCEDLLLIDDNLYMILDGASPIKKQPYNKFSSYAKWFIYTFKEEFEHIYNKNEAINHVVQNCINNIKVKYPLRNLPEIDKPSFTIAAVRLTEREIELSLLGDCCIYVLNKKQEVLIFYDNRIDRFSSITIKMVQNAKRKNLDLNRVIKEQKAKNILFRNKKNGFWVVAYEGLFENEFINIHMKISDVDKILICSDGFNRIFKEFQLYSPKEVMSGLFSFLDIYKELRNYEKLHNSSPLYPCVKVHDDVTALLLQL